MAHDHPVVAVTAEKVSTETQDPVVELVINPAAFLDPVPIVPQVPTDGTVPPPMKAAAWKRPDVSPCVPLPAAMTPAAARLNPTSSVPLAAVVDDHAIGRSFAIV